MTLEQLTRKEQKLYQTASFALHNLVKSNVSLEYIDFFIDEQRFSPDLVCQTSISELLNDIHNKNYQLTEIVSLPSTKKELSFQQEKIKLAKNLNEMAEKEANPEFPGTAEAGQECCQRTARRRPGSKATPHGSQHGAAREAGPASGTAHTSGAVPCQTNRP